MATNNKNRRRSSDLTQDRLQETLRASAAMANDPGSEADVRTSSLNRLVDLRIPLWGILTAAGSVVGLLINMWFAVQNLSQAMADVQMTLKNGSTQDQGIAIDIALMKMRIQALEQQKGVAPGSNP